MNLVYPEWSRATSAAEVDASAATWTLYPIDETGVLNPADKVLADIAASIIGAGLPLTFDGVQVLDTLPGTLGIRYLTSGVYTFLDIASADDVLAFAVVADDAVDTWLGAWLDVRADTSPVTFVGTGAGVPVTFPGGWFIQL